MAGGKTCHCITSGKGSSKGNLLTVVCRMDSQLLELLCPKSHQTCRLSSYREMRKRIKNTKKAPSPLFRYSGEVTRTLQLAVHFPHYFFVTVQHFHDPRQYHLEAKKPAQHTALPWLQRGAGIAQHFPIIRGCCDKVERKENSLNTCRLQVWGIGNHTRPLPLGQH